MSLSETGGVVSLVDGRMEGCACDVGCIRFEAREREGLEVRLTGDTQSLLDAIPVCFRGSWLKGGTDRARWKRGEAGGGE